MTVTTFIAERRSAAATLAPGFLIAVTIAAAARFVSDHYGAPAMLFALLIGMAFHFLSVEANCAPGVEFTSKRLLKIGVALLGARVTLDQIASLGAGPVILIPILIVVTILSGVAFAKAMGKERAFGLLSGGAVAICGASAALAISAVLPKSDAMRRDTLFTVIAVTSLSTIAMVLYPVVFDVLGFSETQIGVLLGASIHDVAQVVGAGYAVSNEAGDIATYVKLLRVSCLPVVVLFFALVLKTGDQAGPDDAAPAKPPFPWFAVWFAIILLANSFGLLPSVIREAMVWISGWLLIAAIAALGMKTSLKAMIDLGGLHIGVVVAETLFLMGAAIVAVKFFLGEAGG